MENSLERRALIRELAIVLIVGVLPMVVIGATLFPPSVDEPPPPFYMANVAQQSRNWIMLATYALFVITPVVAMGRSGRTARHFGIHGGSLGDVKWGLIGFVVNYFAGWIIWLVYRATNFPLGVESIAAFHHVHASSFGEMAATWPWYVMVVIAEESMARCYLITRLTEITGNPWKAVFLSSVLFAFWHSFWGAAGMLHVWKAGMVFGALFVYRGGVLAPAVAHFVFDALSMLPR